jgi:hypothetical protein
MPSTFQDETREEADAVREARERLEEAVEAIPEEAALLEAAQMHATFPPVDNDQDREIAQRYFSKLEQLQDAVFQFRQRLREYENACSEHHRRQMAQND